MLPHMLPPKITKLTDEQIREFQEIWERCFGVQLDRDVAEEYGLELLDLYITLLDPEVERG